MIPLHMVSTGGVLLRDNEVLLVQVNYGTNKGLWMIPGGVVEVGESLEEAVVREMREETGLILAPKRIVGIRNGVKQVRENKEGSIYVVFEMEFISETDQVIDSNEISNIAYFPIEDALSHPNVIDLTKEFIKATLEPTSGLQKVEQDIATNTKYISYDVYRA
ncbi:NUDIX domain-containing protein [Lederbergia graminis]|uniref:NUDIX domain-containing protein n=1 Tax=Lederbergia graminis TaxID=735518 RepID=A0ABW0LFT1_9BACI